MTSGYERVQGKDLPERGLFLGKPYQPAELVRMVQSPIDHFKEVASDRP